MTPVAVKQIDFLPDKYRQATRRRRTSYWRFVVVLMFVGVFVAAAWGMRSTQIAVRREHEQTAARYAAAQAQAATLATREAELAELRSRADLLTFLRTPWPRSQLLAQLFGPLPAGVIVDKLRIVSEAKASAAGAAPEAIGDAAGAVTAAGAAADLAALRKQAESSDLVIHLEGTAADQPGLHAYLHQLTSGNLFRTAEVVSIEAAQGKEGRPAATESSAARFTARIVVRAGWGLPDGPTPVEQPTAEAAPAAESAAPAAGGDA